MQRWFPVWIFPVLIVFSVMTVWIRLAIVRTTYAIDQNGKLIRNLQQEKEQKNLLVAGLKSPRRLEVLAKSKFGLTQPKSEQVVYLK
ncbi:MAG: hypothetical protein HY072_07430 [Deltaproteobacteria bacterium]|nr:hypothetical protein [Deltaproteobacteria bacterium]MBI4924295.1 hypothetical protein [Bdellovibrio sp.]